MTEKTEERYSGPKRYVEYPDAAGRTVQYVRYWHSPYNGQAVVIQFADGLRIHVGIEAVLRVQTEIGFLRDGDLQYVLRHPPILGSPVP